MLPGRLRPKCRNRNRGAQEGNFRLARTKFTEFGVMLAS
jgi:hypothetical protein